MYKRTAWSDDCITREVKMACGHTEEHTVMLWGPVEPWAQTQLIGQVQCQVCAPRGQTVWALIARKCGHVQMVPITSLVWSPDRPIAKAILDKMKADCHTCTEEARAKAKAKVEREIAKEQKQMARAIKAQHQAAMSVELAERGLARP